MDVGRNARPRLRKLVAIQNSRVLRLTIRVVYALAKIYLWMSCGVGKFAEGRQSCRKKARAYFD
jgi:hypothetical protein